VPVKKFEINKFMIVFEDFMELFSDLQAVLQMGKTYFVKFYVIIWVFSNGIIKIQFDLHIYLWITVIEPPRGGGSSTRISLSDSRRSENTIKTHKYNTLY
jgi:hypothetical protein